MKTDCGASGTAKREKGENRKVCFENFLAFPYALAVIKLVKLNKFRCKG